MSLNPALLRSSFELVIEREPELTLRFYEVLFARYPQARALFGRNTQRAQAAMLQNALASALDHLEDTPWLEYELGALGARHLHYGVTDEMYDWVGDSLLTTLAEIAGDAWTDELEQAWAAAYGAIASLMQRGAAAFAPRPSLAETLG
jgi:hemoglobin-like flavoprotein